MGAKMRFVCTFLNDVRYQIKYGFYFLYAFFSAVYIAVLFLCPPEYKKLIASIIVLTDPAMLGSFFIGGIWLLEKGEGLHGFWGISPLRPTEYILSKALSMAVISTVSADLIVLIGIREITDYFALTIGILTGSMIFTVIGLVVASYARSVNHYMLLISPLEIILALPLILAAFGFTHPVLNLLPGMALWNMIGNSVGISDKGSVWALLILVLWLMAAVLYANIRIPKAMRAEGGEKA